MDLKGYTLDPISYLGRGDGKRGVQEKEKVKRVGLASRKAGRVAGMCVSLREH
jgi:hypothetical protein